MKEKNYFLYAIGDGSGVKLGISLSPENRKKQLQTASNRDLTVLWTLCASSHRKFAYKQEKDLHDVCSAYNIRGEWFDMECMLLVNTFEIRGTIEEVEPKPKTNKSTPAQICKTKYGMTLQEASDRTGKDRKTLYNWAKNQESFFHIVMLGCLAVRESEE